MLKTGFTRKLDSVGRLMVPSKLREELRMVNGKNYEFFVEQIDGKTFLCIECPEATDEVAKALDVLAQNGISLSKN